MHKDHKVVTGCSSESNDTQSCGTVLEASPPEVKNIPHHTTTLFSLGLPALDRLPMVALPLPDGKRGASAVGAADVAVASLGHGAAAASHHGS